MSSVGIEFPKEMERARNLRQAYVDIGPPGQFGLLVINGVLREAELAEASGDVVAIVKAFHMLKTLS